jgi:hypothetical protein
VLPPAPELCLDYQSHFTKDIFQEIINAITDAITIVTPKAILEKSYMATPDFCCSVLERKLKFAYDGRIFLITLLSGWITWGLDTINGGIPYFRVGNSYFWVPLFWIKGWAMGSTICGSCPL